MAVATGLFFCSRGSACRACTTGSLRVMSGLPGVVLAAGVACVTVGVAVDEVVRVVLFAMLSAVSVGTVRAGEAC